MIHFRFEFRNYIKSKLFLFMIKKSMTFTCSYFDRLKGYYNCNLSCRKKNPFNFKLIPNFIAPGPSSLKYFPLHKSYKGRKIFERKHISRMRFPPGTHRHRNSLSLLKKETLFPPTMEVPCAPHTVQYRAIKSILLLPIFVQFLPSS